MIRLFMIMVLVITFLTGCGGSADVSPAGQAPPGLLAQMEREFARINPRVTHIHVLNLIADPSRPGHRYAALATATTSEPVELSDELFGVFVVDSTITRIERVVETFPSGRLRDYTVLISFPTSDTLLVRGFGTMDSESSIRHPYAWSP